MTTTDATRMPADVWNVPWASSVQSVTAWKTCTVPRYVQACADTNPQAGKPVHFAVAAERPTRLQRIALSCCFANLALGSSNEIW